ncbi:MAG TPA: hypothetical protein VMT19_02055 [Thermoanaerobaculaceae bacterium]|nr:hypothetical protein [Thermoanaerobaculaceae bacterium]
MDERAARPGSQCGGRRSDSWRWVAAAAGGVAALCLLALVLGGTYVPRKNAARDLRAKRERVVTLLSALPVERGRVGESLDCVVRGVFRNRLSVAQVAPLRQTCAAALADDVVTPQEAAAIEAAASALCRRAGGPGQP